MRIGHLVPVVPELPQYCRLISSREFPDFKQLVWCMKDTEMSPIFLPLLIIC